MNERIKELAERAYGTRKHVPPVWQFYDSELEKLVESIVRECALLASWCESEQIPNCPGHILRQFGLQKELEKK